MNQFMLDLTNFANPSSETVPRSTCQDAEITYFKRRSTQHSEINDDQKWMLLEVDQ